jgi:hypothetical protein
MRLGIPLKKDIISSSKEADKFVKVTLVDGKIDSIEEVENRDSLVGEVDFFIKQNCYFSTSNLIERISKISNVSLVYKVQSNELSENFNLDI